MAKLCLPCFLSSNEITQIDTKHNETQSFNSIKIIEAIHRTNDTQ